MRDLAVSLDPNQVSPGLLGFIIVCILGVCVWLLCRNMGKHLTKLDNDYRAEQEAEQEALQTVESAAAAPAIPAQSAARPAEKPAKPRPTKA